MTESRSNLDPLVRLLDDGSPSARGGRPHAPLPRESSPSSATSATVAPVTPRKSLRFQPGLEGLRGLAVLGVLVFHGGFTWATGGFLGVSTFFTLSGFLITSLLLKEHASTGTIALKAFWGRRFRRLMPASLVCIAGVVFLFAPFVASPAQLDNLQGDVFSSLAYIANWHFIASGQSYEQVFSDPSPVLHFWSLAIEEQFYVVFPLLMSFLVVRWAARRSALLWILAGLAVASTLEMALLYNPADTSRVYYGTDTRAAELLAGAVLAIVVIDRTLLPRAVRAAAIVAGAVSLALVVWLWHAVGQTDSWLYRGGFAFYALLSCSIIVAATQPGVVKVVLSNPVFRWLGRISYAAYLFHWPIFLWISPESTGWNLWPLFAVRLAVTFALAELSLRLIEKPIRERKFMTAWQPWVAAPVAIALLVAMTIHVVNQPRDLTRQITLEENKPTVRAEDAPITTTTLLDAGTAISPAPEGPPLLPHATGRNLEVMLQGDSALGTLGGLSPYGLVGWGESTGRMTVSNYSKFGCGIARGGTQQYAQKIEEAGVLCADWKVSYLLDIEGRDGIDGPVVESRADPELVVAMVGIWDVLNKQLAGDDQWRHIGDPQYDAFFARELAEAMDLLTSRGAIVIWLTHPPVQIGITEGIPKDEQPENDPARMNRLNEIIEKVGATRPHVRVIDLADYMASRPEGALDLTERPDGIHWTNAANGVLSQWLGPQLIETYDTAWNEITAQAAEASSTDSSTSSGG